MFGKMMNNYYYGKSGKGDFKKEDMPETRWQLFWDTLRTRLASLFRLNFLYMVIWLPAMVVLLISLFNLNQNLNTFILAVNGELTPEIMESMGKDISEEELAGFSRDLQANPGYVGDYTRSEVSKLLLILIPCIAITGPFTAGVSYVTRNWSRDEHAFIWSDFKDAVKENWKQSLLISTITGLMPFVLYTGWTFYSGLAADQIIMMVPQMLMLVIGILWAVSVTYMHPLIVTYDLKIRDLFRNGFLLGVGRLPMSVAIRLLHCVPLLIGAAVYLLWQPFYALIGLFAYYFLIGFSLSRFVTASYTNAVFDRFINSRIEGAQVNKGLRAEEDDDPEEENEEPEQAE